MFFFITRQYGTPFIPDKIHAKSPKTDKKGSFNARLRKFQRTKSGRFDRTTAVLFTGFGPHTEFVLPAAA
jgi:hypothetical protein